MTPKEAAEALSAALPAGITPSNLDEYGIMPTAERAQAVSREVLSLNLFWIGEAIDAHIPQKYRSLIAGLVLEAVESAWPDAYGAGGMAWATFVTEWRDRKRHYERLVRDGASHLTVSAEVALSLEEQGVVNEEERRNVLTLLIDSVAVESYGQLLQDVG